MPGKNLRKLGALTLIDRAVLDGLALGVIPLVSTDYTREEMRVFGDYRHVPRPPELATDKASMWAVLSHLYREQHWRDEDRIVLLQPTSLHKDRTEIAKRMLKEGVIPSCTVDRVPDRWHPWYAQSADSPHCPPSCRQSLPPRFRPNGLVYLLSGATARKESFWADQPKFYDTPDVINIDTPKDWAEAECVYGGPS